MKNTANLEDLIKKLYVAPTAQTHQRILNVVLDEHDKVKKTRAAVQRKNIWRTIMKSRITKLAVAAAIVMAVLIGINQFGGSIDLGNVAWAEVAGHLSDVDYVHIYAVQTKEGDFPSIREGWYAYGKLRSRSCGGFSSFGEYQSFDDGQTSIALDRHNNVTCVRKSGLAKHQTFFEAATGGMLSFKDSQFNNKTPVLTTADFLIYDFEPPEEVDWIEKISVTVGRNSLIPIQIKTYYKTEKWYSSTDLVLFDYEDPEKPIEFFDVPTEIKPPHGIGHVVLGGDEVEIELHNAPGIKKAIVRLHTRFDGPAEDLLIPYRERYEIVGGPVYFMEITFIIDEGYRSNTSKKCPLWLNQGVKAALGKADTWPDGKYRNIRYTPVLRATDDENVFILELSCWLRTKDIL